MYKRFCFIFILLQLEFTLNGQIYYNWWFENERNEGIIERVVYEKEYRKVNDQKRQKIKKNDLNINDSSIYFLFNQHLMDNSVESLDSTFYHRKNYNYKGLLVKLNGREFHIDYWRTISKIYNYDSKNRITSEILLDDKLDTLEIKKYTYSNKRKTVILNSQYYNYVWKYNQDGFLDSSIQYYKGDIDNFTKYSFSFQNRVLSEFKDSTDQISCKYKFDKNNRIIDYYIYGDERIVIYKSNSIYDLHGNIIKKISQDLKDKKTETTYYRYKKGSLNYIYKETDNGEILPIQQCFYKTNKLSSILYYDKDGYPRNQLYFFDKIHE